jgi:hypothetical protein
MLTPAHNPTVIRARSTDGIDAWVDLDRGRVWPVVSGADEGEEGNQGAQPTALTPEQQAHVDRLIGQARIDGRQSGATEARTEIETYLTAEQQAAQQAEMEEVDRVAAERDQARTQAQEAAAARTAAETARDRVVLDAFAMVALIGADLPHSAVTDALRLLDHQPGDDEAALATRVEALKGRVPGLWGATAGQQLAPAPPPPPAGGGPRPSPAQGETPYERGQRLVRENPHLRIA